VPSCRKSSVAPRPDASPAENAESRSVCRIFFRPFLRCVSDEGRGLGFSRWVLFRLLQANLPKSSLAKAHELAGLLMPRASDEKTAKGIKTRRHSSCYLPTSPLVLCHHNSALHYFAPHHPWCILSNKCIEFLHMLTPCSVRRSSSSLSQLPEVEA
jgi:hypothetical protein